MFAFVLPKIERLQNDVKNDDLRTLCTEHKNEMEESGMILKFIKEYKLEMCDKCEKLGFTFCVKGKKRKNTNREY